MRIRGWLSHVVVAVAVLLGATLVGHLPPAASAAVPPRPCQRLGVIGGSLTVGSEPYQERELVEMGITRIRSDARVGRSVGGRTGAITALEAMRADGFVPDCLVISLGTNMFPARNEARYYDEWIVTMMDAIGPAPRVLWVNVFREQDRDIDAGFNDALVRLQRRYPNLKVADWESYIEERTDWLAGDGVHVGVAGYKERARWIATEVHAQLQGGGPTRPPGAPCALVTVPLRNGARGPGVLCLERRLAQLRWTTRQPDTNYDDATARVVAEWQRRHGLDDTGVVDTATRSALGLRIADLVDGTIVGSGRR
jgi:peptidoglycan hydrolase-like protein with peptidoglycan-binding domain